MFFSNPFCNLSKSRSWQRYFPDFTPKWYPKGYPRIASKSLENKPSKNNDFHTPPVDCKYLPPAHSGAPSLHTSLPLKIASRMVETPSSTLKRAFRNPPRCACHSCWACRVAVPAKPPSCTSTVQLLAHFL